VIVVCPMATCELLRFARVAIAYHASDERVQVSGDSAAPVAEYVRRQTHRPDGTVRGRMADSPPPPSPDTARVPECVPYCHSAPVRRGSPTPLGVVGAAPPWRQHWSGHLPGSLRHAGLASHRKPTPSPETLVTWQAAARHRSAWVKNRHNPPGGSL